MMQKKSQKQQGRLTKEVTMPRAKTPQLGPEAVKTALKVLEVIAPHVPPKGLSNVTAAEAVINFAWQQAQILKANTELQKKVQQGDTMAIIEQLRKQLKDEGVDLVD